MADVVSHINESEAHERRVEIADAIRNHAGVMGVAHHDEKRHLLIVEYDPDQVHAASSSQSRQKMLAAYYLPELVEFF